MVASIHIYFILNLNMNIVVVINIVIDLWLTNSTPR